MPEGDDPGRLEGSLPPEELQKGGGRLPLLQFYQQAGPVSYQFQDFFQGGNGLPLAGIQSLQFRQSEILDQAAAIGGAVQGLVVDHH